MRYSAIAVFLSLLLLFSLVGCGNGDTRDAVTGDMVSLLHEYSDLLDGVTDKTTAEAAAVKMEDMQKRLQAILSRGGALSTPKAEEVQALQKKYGEAMQTTVQRVAESSIAVEKQPEAAEVLMGAMNKFAAKFEEGQGR